MSKDNYEDFIESEKIGVFIDQIDEFGYAIVTCPRCLERNPIQVEDMEPFCYFCGLVLDNPFDTYSGILGEFDN